MTTTPATHPVVPAVPATPSSPPHLQVIVDEPPDPDAWSPLDWAAHRWQTLSDTDFDGHLVPPSKSVRAYELLAAYFWAYEADGEVYAVQRTSRHRPTGGVLRPLDSRLTAFVSSRFSTLDERTVCSATAIRDAITRWKGTACQLKDPPFVRWGRGSDGALWWDSGGSVFVRVDATGWTVVEDVADCWFVRPPGHAELPPPQAGGAIKDLWSHVNVAAPDRRLVVSWLLASMLPGPTEAAGMLYITGPAGSGKSTAMSVLTSAAGGEANRQAQTDTREAARDLFATARSGWVLGIDNVSALSAAASDHLCTIISGITKRVRTLYTTSDVTAIHVRRPAIATAIDIPVLREDLIRRMVPVTLSPLASPLDDHTLATRWADAQPKVFGALLDLMVQVLAAGDPPSGTPLSTLPSWGRCAWALDRIKPPSPGQLSTIDECLVRRTALSADDVHDDPWWRQVAFMLNGQPFTGTLATLVNQVERPPNVDYHSWPTARTLPGRIERHREGLTAAGWRFEKLDAAAAPGAHRAPRWRITPPPPVEPEPGADLEEVV
jgi:hypothetical protein